MFSINKCTFFHKNQNRRPSSDLFTNSGRVLCKKGIDHELIIIADTTMTVLQFGRCFDQFPPCLSIFGWSHAHSISVLFFSAHTDIGIQSSGIKLVNSFKSLNWLRRSLLHLAFIRVKTRKLPSPFQSRYL